MDGVCRVTCGRGLPGGGRRRGGGRRWRLWAAVVLACAPTADLSAQAPQFRHLGTDDGLPGAWVTSILQDRTGYMWFGTASGLSRYDGITMKVYRRRLNDPAALPDNKINALLVDTRGTLWVGTTLLSRYDPGRDAFIHYMAPGPTEASRFIRSLFEDSRGQFWVSSNFGVFRFDRRSGKAERLNLAWPNSPPQSLRHLLLEDRRHHLWIAAPGGGLADYDPVTGAVRVFRKDGRPGSLPDDDIRAGQEDAAGRLWLATATRGLVLYDPRTDTFRSVSRRAGDGSSLVSDRVQALLPDETGGLWLGTEGGLDHFDPPSGRFTHYAADPRNPAALTDESVWSLYRDAGGILWVGTFAGGLNLLSPQSDAIRLYRPVAGDVSSLANPFVQGLAQDARGAVWVADGLGGINRFEPQTGHFTRFNRQPAGLNVLAVAPDPDGSVWAGTWDGGLARLDPRAGTFTTLTTRNSRIPTDRIFAVTVDRGGALWIGTFQSGLLRYDRARGTFTEYRIAPPGQGQSQIWQILELQDGRLALATLENGLVLFDPRTGALRAYWAQRGQADALASDQVNGLLETPAGTLWIGTTAGLDRMDLRTGHISHITEAQGLPSNVVSGLVADAAGNVWISTVKGIVRFRPGFGPTRYFTSADGLQASEFNPHAALRLRDGTLLFGGGDGLNTIRPDRLVPNRQRPPVVLTSLELFNRPAVVGVPGSPLERALGETRRLVLRHDQSMFTLSFAALDYVAPGRNQYAYKLEGFDRDWVHVGSAHTASYAGLPPGEYVFRVMASNNDGLWNERGASLPITIQPPLTGTWWFRVLVGLALAALTVGALVNARRRHLMLRSMNARLAAAAERDRSAEQDLERKVLEVLADTRRSVSGGDSLPVPLEGDEAIAALRRGIGEILADRRRAEEDLRQSQKLEAVGRLAGGLAQDFEQLLAVIDDNLAVALSELESERAIRLDLEEVRHAARSAGALTRQLLAFDRKEDPQQQLLSLNALIQEMARMLGGAAGETVQVVLRLDFGLGRVRADRGQIERILLNLIVHARDVMPAGGTIVIQTENVTGDAVPAPGADRAQAYVALSVRYTGPRFVEQRDQGAEPWLAVAGTGRAGGGLGPSSIEAGVEQSGGLLHVESSPGLGTTFSIYLPRTEGHPSAEPPGEAQPAQAAGPPHTVLLVEADDERRHRAVGVLQRAGYSVVGAYSGSSALKLATDHSGPIHLLVTNVLMPGMSGRDLAERLMAARAGLTVLYTHAHGEDAVVRKGVPAENVAFLERPFTPEQLLSKVRTILERPPGGSTETSQRGSSERGA